MSRLIVSCAVALFAVGACSTEETRVDCERLVDHYLELTGFDAVRHRAAYVYECSSMSLSPDNERCILAATSMVDLDRCGVMRVPSEEARR